MSSINLVISTVMLNQPWTKPWSADELERVFACPICGCAEREMLHKGLIDNVFFVAPGRWKMHRCTKCHSAYLDPRPNSASIGKAYGTYYTHNVGKSREDVIQVSHFRRWRRKLANGYTNQRYGTVHQPASFLGALAARLLPQQRQTLDVQFRYLPKPEKGQRLLDIGCGNGEFLICARSAGWDVLGLDPDPKAAAAAKGLGLNVLVGDIGKLAEESDCFDAITLSHVIEHVHSPLEVLTAVYRLLKPGGVVYIDTPNIDSCGAKLFGKNWRGLETPRHLVLFNPDSLQKLLTEIGFNLIKMKRRTAVIPWMYSASFRIAQGKKSCESELSSLTLMEKIKILLYILKTENLEFVTLTARKNK